MVSHPIRVSGYDGAKSVAAPALLARVDQDFIGAVLDELGSEGGRSKLAASRAKGHDKDKVLRLFQPVHRVFHVAMIEVACDEPGSPRLDPRKIAGAGLVVRRVQTRDRQAHTTTEAWVRAGKKIAGWVPLATRREQELDPDPAMRAATRSGNDEIDRRLALLQVGGEPLTEHVTSLFVAPPDACKAAGKTVLYGLVPVTSSELRETVTRVSYEADEVAAQIPTLLREGNHPVGALAGVRLTSAIAAAYEGDGFVDVLRLLAISLDAFGTSAASKRLYGELERIAVPDPPRRGGAFLHDAYRVLVLREPGLTLDMPRSWQTISASVASGIAAAAKACLEARLAAQLPASGRFDAPGARYVARAFVRVKRDDGCPPDLVWTEPSEPFTIAPWFENGPLPPLQIALPDITRESVKKLKPNVTFAVPKALFGMLSANKPKDLIDGKGSQGGGGGIAWLCGFNIPIITICAFIVLSIFLSLLNIVFWWLPFVKICVPMPKAIADRLPDGSS